MDHISRLIGRLAPAFLLAGGVTLLTAGLLTYAPAGVGGQPAGTPIAGDPASTPGSLPGTPRPSVMPTDAPPAPGYLPGDTPLPTEPVTPAPTPASDAIATRITIPSLRIDLPIVAGDLDVPGNRNNYPLCDVAQYMTVLGQPGEQGTAYIYAHAQRGMFLPMLRASWRNDGREMIGALVEVYTSDLRLHLYEIFRVKRHATDLSLAFELEPGEHRLVLQTSEGPEGTIPKLQVAARPISVVPSTATEALPEPQPRPCPPPR